MSDSNGVFVHLFRNKEVWKQSEGMLETTKGKFEAEEEYRKRLAAEAGLTEDGVKMSFNSQIDAKLFYPELGSDSSEYIAWWFGWREKDCVNSSAGELQEIERILEIPTEVIEEKALFKKYRIFENGKWDTFTYKDGKNTHRYRLMYGSRGNRRYLVAYWGEKKYYDGIQQKLAELEVKKRVELEAEKRKALEKEEDPLTAKDQKVSKIAAFAGVVTIIILGIVILCGSLPEKKKNTASTQPRALEPLSPYECDLLHKCSISLYCAYGYQVFGKVIQKCDRHGEHFILDCRSKIGKLDKVSVARETFDNFKIGEIIQEKKKENVKEKKQVDHEVVSPIDEKKKNLENCTLGAIDFLSVYSLPKGVISEKATWEPRSCPRHQEHFLIWIENKELRQYYWGAVDRLTFDKINVGDKVPFKKPEY